MMLKKKIFPFLFAMVGWLSSQAQTSVFDVIAGSNDHTTLEAAILAAQLNDDRWQIQPVNLLRFCYTM
ncbi:MAG: hypothetical protein MUF42_17335 [Cytophagaceae bacterium]|nr:hypothetical protein [Cytophagaceae bacterium]